MFSLAFFLLLTWSFPMSLASVLEQRQAESSFWCGPASTNSDNSLSVFCQCSSYSYRTVYPVQAPNATSAAVVGLGTVTSTLTVTYTTSDAACSYTSASQASSISTPPAQTSTTTTPSATSVAPSTTPPPVSSTTPMACSLVSSSVCSCDGKFVTDVDRAGFCGPRSLSVVAPANCVTVPMSAYEQKPLAGCMCLDHWGPVENSDLKVGASNWTDDTRVHIMQPDENCSPYLLEQWPYCRAQNFEDNTIDCDCQAWPEDNWLEPYQVNNPCIQAPYTTSVLATCIYLPPGLKKRFVGGPVGARGHCRCIGGGITSNGPVTPCPSSTFFPSTSSIDVVTATGACAVSSTSLSGGTVDFCLCSASSGTVSLTSTFPQCTIGPYTAVIIQA